MEPWCRVLCRILTQGLGGGSPVGSGEANTWVLTRSGAYPVSCPVKRPQRQGDDVASALRERSPADTPADVRGVSHLPRQCGWFKGRLISWFSKILPKEREALSCLWNTKLRWWQPGMVCGPCLTERELLSPLTSTSLGPIDGLVASPKPIRGLLWIFQLRTGRIKAQYPTEQAG